MEFISFLEENALAEMKLANKELTDMVANVEKVGQKIKGISTPSGSDAGVKGLTEQYAKQQKVIASMQIQLERYAQAQNRTKISTNQLEQSEIRLNKAKEQSVKTLEREQAKLNASTNLYNKVQAKMNLLINDYKALATRKELGITLTAKEEATYNRLQASIQRYDKVLKGVDASMGKYQRNVGNYGSAFNPVSNSINQLTREMPAFANSVQTGFMAISNNLPIFFDAMQQAIAQQKELQAQGQPSKNALQLLAGSFFTLGTALSIGVTLLTVFGAQIVDSIFNTKAKTKADEEAKKAVEEKNNAEQRYINTIKSSASEEISRSKLLLENAKNLNLPMKERLKAIAELKERYPDYLGNLSKEALLSGQTADAENRLNEALMKRGIAIALQGKLTEKYNELSDIILKINGAQEKKSSLDEKDILNATKLTGSRKQAIKDLTLVSDLTIKKNNIDKVAKEQEIQSLIDLYNKYSPYLSAVNEDATATEKKTKAKEESNKIDSDSLKAMENTINELKRVRSETSYGTTAYGLLGNQIGLLEEIYKGLTETITKSSDELEGIEILDTDMLDYTEQALIKLEEATESFIGTLASDQFNKAFDNIGLSSAKMFLDFDAQGRTTFSKLLEGADTVQEKFAVTFQAVGDVAQQTFTLLSELGTQNTTLQLERLEQERDVALLFAGESASAREEIERQYEQRQREIKRRDFQTKKKQALFNIAIDTAQGVVSALASTPPNVPLSVAIGAIGLIQAGVVASQQMPEFWRGTDNAPEGWALTQERGREIITDAKGNIKSLGNDKGATATYLNKGDKVFNNEKTMDFLMFNSGLNNILASNQIALSNQKETANTLDLSPVVSAINNKESVNLNIDRNGIKTLITSGNTTRQIMNNRVRGIGKIL